MPDPLQIVAAKTPTGATVFTTRRNAVNSEYQIKRDTNTTDPSGRPHPPKYAPEPSEGKAVKATESTKAKEA